MPATRTISTSPSPSRRHCSRSASSLSCKTSVYITRSAGGDGGAVEEGGEARQLERLGDGGDARGARVARDVGQRRKLVERRFDLRRPLRHVERLSRAAPGQVVPDHAEAEV